jgi:hypothetical protein
MNWPVLAALIWSISANILALLPHSWNRKGAYTLIACIFPICWGLAVQHHWGWAAGFVALTLFQLRLLLRHWWRKWRVSRHVGRPK